MKTRQFDPAYIPSHLIRLFLGALVGGLIVLFPSLLPASNEANVELQSKGIYGMSDIANTSLAFVLGYAVDIYYSVLDNIGGKVKNRG